MSVNVTGDRALGFVSTLDNSDFQAKSLQDIKLIELRLQLTGDTSAITKYDEALKASAASEIQLRNNLNKILEDAKQEYADLVKVIEQKPAGTSAISEIAVEIEAASEQFNGFRDNGVVALSGVNELIKKLNEDFTAGTISAEEFKAAIDNIGQFEVFKQQELDAIAAKKAIEEEVGIIQELKATLAELKAENITIVDPELLAASNSKIQEVTADLARATNVGKLGFDEFGDKIVVVNEEIQTSIGLIGSLQAELAALKAERIDIVDPVHLSQVNAVIQDLETNIAQLGNKGKAGFNEMGVAIEETVAKQSKFSAAISRVTDISNIGARVVTQFTRQIIGLGVGFISLEIGAKAIQSLITYIENLDVFTGRLDQAKQNLLAFNEVMLNADKASGAQVGALKQLYETATSTNVALKDRLAAAEQLRDSYSAEFQNASALAIINGKLKGSYDDLTNSILAVAKSQAVATKAGQLQEVIDNANYQKQKIRNANANEIAGYRQVAATDNSRFAQNNLFARITESNARAKEALKTQDETINIAKNQQDFLVSSVKTITKTTQDLADANALLGSNLENFDKLIAGVQDKKQLDNIQNALQIKLNQVGLAPGAADKIKADLQKVKDLEKQYEVKATPTKSPTDPGIALLASQKSLLENIDALKEKYASKDKTRAEQEVDDIIATYNKQYEAVVAQNVKVDAYIKKYGQGAANKLGLKIVDPNSISASEMSALNALGGKQSAEETIKNLDSQKVLFEQYQAFKVQAGQAAADKLFAGELAGYKNYLDYLKSLQPTEADLNSSDPYVKAKASALNDYLKTELPKAQADEIKLQQKQLQDLLIQNQTYEQQRETIVQKGLDNVKVLQTKGFTDQAQLAAAAFQAELALLDDDQKQKIQNAKEFAGSLLSLTKEQAELQIKTAKDQNDQALATGKISVETFKAVADAIKQAEAELGKNTIANYFDAIGASLTTLGGEISKSHTELGSIVSGLGSTLTTLKSLSDLTTKISANGGFLKSIEGADFKDAISVVTTGLTAIIGLIDSISSAAAQRKQAAEDYYNSVISLQDSYNLSLNEQIRLQYQSDNNAFFTNTAAELSDAAKAYKDATDKFDASLTALKKGQAIVGTKNAVSGSAILKDAGNGAVAGAAIGAVLGGGVASVATAAVGAVIGGIGGAIVGLFAGKKKENVLQPLLDVYPQLITADGKLNEALAKSLIASGSVTDATKTALQNTVDLYDAQKAAIDQITTALQSLVGTLGDNISNALVTAFENGTDAAKAFQQAVSDILSNIIQQDLFVAIFGDKLQALQAKLTADSLANDGNTQAEIIADIKNFYANSGDLVKQYTAGLQAAKDAGAGQGLTLFPSGTTGASATLSGGIQASITEDTANILSGTLKGIQLNTLNTNNILEGHSLSFGQMVSIGQDQLNTQIEIRDNTKKSADNSDKMVSALYAVAENTKSTIGDQLRAAGQLGF